MSRRPIASAVVQSGFRMKGISAVLADKTVRRVSHTVRSFLFADANTVEGRQAERADFEVLDGAAHRLIHRRVRDRCHRNLLFEQVLRLFVQPGALSHIGGGLGLFD